MPKIAEIVLYDSEDEYRSEFVTRYVNGAHALYGIPVSFIAENFDHIFYEPAKGGQKDAAFSKRRAKKMRFVEVMLAGDGIAIEVMFEDETGNLAVFCVDLDCVIYLRIRKGTGKLQLATFFDFGNDHTKMYEKQKRKCVSVTDTQVREML